MLLAVAAVCSWWRGQDSNWDLLNYHYYNAWAFLHGGQHLDYLVAGIQGYFSPLLDIPYYELAAGPLSRHPQLLAAVAGIPYGFALFLAYLLAETFAERLALETRLQRIAFVSSSIALAGTAAATWSQVGTTTNDLSIAILVLLGFLLVLRGLAPPNRATPRRWRILASGTLLGCAAGLKLTAAIYAPAMCIAIVLTGSNRRQALLEALLLSLACGMAFALTYGPWGWHLYAQTGNPFFPMFNDFFHSPWGPPTDWRDLRSLPKGTMQWIFYPFYWLNDTRITTSDLPFRDLRLAVFYALLFPFLLTRLTQKRERDSFGSSLPIPIDFAVTFTVLSYLLWLLMFSILRYLVVIEILVGTLTPTLLVYVAQRFFGARNRTAAIGAATLLAASSIAYARPPDWGHVPYDQGIFELPVPTLPANSIVVLADQPLGFFAALLAQRQSSLEFIGTPAYFKAFEEYELGRIASHKVHDKLAGAYVAYYSNSVPSFPGLPFLGISIDPQNCQTIASTTLPSIRLCKARAIRESNRPVVAYRLEANSTSEAGTRLGFDWKVNPCSTEAQFGAAGVAWNISGAEISVAELYVRTPPYAFTLFAAGGPEGHAVTGSWIRAGEEFVLRTKAGRELASATISYAPCSEAVTTP
jgi:hypothetical protein